MAALDLTGGGDIIQANWGDVKNIYQNYSRAAHKKTRGYTPSIKKTTSWVSRMEITYLLKDFKHDIIKNMVKQLDTFQVEQKHDEAEAMLAEYCPYCRQKKKDCRCKKIANIERKKV